MDQQQITNFDSGHHFGSTDHGNVEVQLQHQQLVLPLEVTANSCPENDTNSQHLVLAASSAGEEESVQEPAEPLTRRQMFNLLFCVLAWACTIANVTLVVGTSNVVILSLGGDSSLTSVPLATFFLGAALVSLTVTPWHFQRLGRTWGFLTGVGVGLLGTTLGCLAVSMHSPALLIVATAAFGAAMGIGFYLRFAAVELIPPHWADKAVTLVVSGGCIAAFAGPESAEATRGIFGDDYMYMGVFLMTGVFNALNGVFTSLVYFPSKEEKSKEHTATEELQEEIPGVEDTGSGKQQQQQQQQQQIHRSQIFSILQTRSFIVPVLISTLTWIIMALPMSVLRVAMHHLGYTSRQSLLTIELHFLGMYAPGFFTGQWIARLGPRLVSMGAVSVFLVAFSILQFAQEASASAEDGVGMDMEDNQEWGLAVWIIGMIIIGIGWNCGFSASTVGSTRSYASRPDCKSAIQAANDGLTFLLAGAIICSASFIYQAGGGGLEGWIFVNWIVLGFICSMGLILGVDYAIDQRQSQRGLTHVADSWSSPSPLR